jgi:hypothetical protein
VANIKSQGGYTLRAARGIHNLDVSKNLPRLIRGLEPVPAFASRTASRQSRMVAGSEFRLETKNLSLRSLPKLF